MGKRRDEIRIFLVYNLNVKCVDEISNDWRENKSESKKKKTNYTLSELERLINCYFDEYLKQSGEVADIESLADYLGSTRDEIMAMMNDKKLGRLFRIARNRIANIKKQLAFGGKIPAAVLSFDLKNNHGYKDKPDEGEAIANESVVFKGKASDWAK